MEKELKTSLIGIELRTKLSDELVHGTYLSKEQMKELGMVPITAVMPEATKLANITARLKLEVSEDHNLEVFQVEDKNAGIQYLQKGGLAESSIAAPPRSYLMGVRNKDTKGIIVPAEYQYLDIIDQDTILVNNFLVIPLKYLDGTVKFADQFYQNDTLNQVKPSEVIFKIMSTKDYFYAIEREGVIILIRAEHIFEATLTGYTKDELEALGVTKSNEAAKPRTRMKV